MYSERINFVLRSWIKHLVTVHFGSIFPKNDVNQNQCTVLPEKLQRRILYQIMVCTLVCSLQSNKPTSKNV